MKGEFNMKKKYITAECEIQIFAEKDIVMVSLNAAGYEGDEGAYEWQ